jgi:PKHD-type hydroxylase
MSIQLSPADEYDGGNLDLMLGRDALHVADRTPGAGILFPSWVMHRVSPVTRGVRRSLVVWMNGPEFK